MGEVKIPRPALLFCGLLLGDNIEEKLVIGELEKHFGDVILKSRVFPFNHTDYYYEEMGINIRRMFVGFNKTIEMERIVDIKLLTNKVELENFSSEGRRKVNIDPGYINLSKVVLATTKDYQHRIYLGCGIYAEVTLRYRKGTFTPWEWTYPDYREKASIDFFNRLRENYKKLTA